MFGVSFAFSSRIHSVFRTLNSALAPFVTSICYIRWSPRPLLHQHQGCRVAANSQSVGGMGITCCGSGPVDPGALHMSTDVHQVDIASCLLDAGVVRTCRSVSGHAPAWRIDAWIFAFDLPGDALLARPRIGAGTLSSNPSPCSHHAHKRHQLHLAAAWCGQMSCHIAATFYGHERLQLLGDLASLAIGLVVLLHCRPPRRCQV